MLLVISADVVAEANSQKKNNEEQNKQKDSRNG